MADKKLIESIHLSNFLSFGPEAPSISLEPLNVLIGPNASGKSNLIEAIEILRAAPKDLAGPIREGGGIREWLWKGQAGVKPARIDTVLSGILTSAGESASIPLRHILEFGASGERIEVTDEALEENSTRRPDHDESFFYYRFRHGNPAIRARTGPEREDGVAQVVLRDLKRESIIPDQSILSQRKDPDLYPEITETGRAYSKIQTFREWSFGRLTPLRKAQPTDLPNDTLLPDGQNLALILNDLEHHSDTWSRLLQLCGKLLPRFKDISVKISAGNAQIYLHEKGLQVPIPASRLSDGTLRFLCLTALLLHHKPPPLICIEEPELGLHPDAISAMADLIIEASERTQLIVTTHSDLLVNALTDRPSAVMVFEQTASGTNVQRLDPERLKDWLKRYSLGELSMKGEIGGVRW